MSQVVYILDRFAKTNLLYNTWIDDCPFDIKIVDSPVEDWHPPEDSGLVITHEHFRWETVSTLRRIMDLRVLPVLILCDGILEYRNTWENPTIADGSVYQNVFGHKVACLGRAGARIIESFGNAGLCEIVGHPRFDQSFQSESLPVQNEGPFRLLVTTARTPAFNEEQHKKVVQGLVELKQRFDRNMGVAGRKVKIDWRLSPELLTELELPLPEASYRMPSLSDAIETSDAVITTPSTVYLESVIKRRPTAILDFTNSPSYVPSAWQITAAAHINPTLEELAVPPAAKMFFQRCTLHDQVELGHNAGKQLFDLMNVMLEAGAKARADETEIELPARILSDPQRGIAKIEDEFDLASLFPKSYAFQQSNVIRLQQELVHAVARIGQLPKDLHERDDQLVKKGEHIDSLSELLEEAECRIESANQRVDELTRMQEVSADVLSKKSQHIDRLTGLLEEAHEQLKEVRGKFRKRADAMLAVAAQLTKEVKESGLNSTEDTESELDEMQRSNAKSPKKTPAKRNRPSSGW